MGLAEFGRKELTLAEHEMPGLMAARKELALIACTGHNISSTNNQSSSMLRGKAQMNLTEKAGTPQLDVTIVAITSTNNESSPTSQVKTQTNLTEHDGPAQLDVTISAIRDVRSWWSSWYGEEKGTKQPAQVCPFGYISEFTMVGNIYNGLHDIGLVRCNDGTVLHRGASSTWLDRKKTYSSNSGFSKFSGMYGVSEYHYGVHSNCQPGSESCPVDFWKMCLDNQCEERARMDAVYFRSSFDQSCENGLKIAGFKIRTSGTWNHMDGIKFYCQSQGSICRKGGRLAPISSSRCPAYHVRLPACFLASFGQLCEGTGSCYEDAQLNNCDGRSIYAWERVL